MRGGLLHGNEAHVAWSPDGESIVFTSSRMGFKDEAVYTDAPQPYGEISWMRYAPSEIRAGATSARISPTEVDAGVACLRTWRELAWRYESQCAGHGLRPRFVLSRKAPGRKAVAAFIRCAG